MIYMRVKVDIKNVEEMKRKRMTGAKGDATTFLTTQVYEKCDPRVPFFTGNLRLNVELKTNRIIYKAKKRTGKSYAYVNFKSNKGNGKEGMNRGGQRGRDWLMRTMAADGDKIGMELAKFMGGEYKKK